MFEGLVASLLNKYLSQYIDEVDYNNLKLGIFSGTLELLNVKIKPSALYQFDLPIEVKAGLIGKLKINLSWTNFNKQPAILILEDLFVLLGPFEEKINDPKRIEELLAAHKKKQLQEIDKLDQAQLYESENKEKGLAERVQDTIINNIQIQIKNVHIRYEDKHSLEKKVVSAGVYLKEFRAETVDVNGQANFLNADERIIFKKGTLTGFNLYWNSVDTIDSLISTRADFKPKQDTWMKVMKQSIDSGKIYEIPFQTMIEKNLDLSTFLTLRRSFQKDDFTVPKIVFKSSVNTIEFCFQRQQYKSILQIVDVYSLLNVHKRYVKYRPPNTTPKQNPRLWWKYMFTAHAETKWRLYKKERMLQHWRNYKVYMSKYEKKLQLTKMNKPIPNELQKELDNLENKLTLESLMDLRDLCNQKFQENSKEVVKKPNQTKPEENTELTKRPLNYVEFRLILNFRLISLKLKILQQEILRVDFTQIFSVFEVRPVADSIFFSLNTQSIDISGIYYKESLKQGQNQLVPIVKSKENKPLKRLNELKDDILINKEDYLFTFSIETNPTNMENVEFTIKTNLSSVEVYYEKTAITEILRFFRTDLIDFEEVKKIREVWSRAGIIYALENHKQFHIEAELSSPYFIIPIKGTNLEEGNSIVFYLGKTIIKSQIQPKLVNFVPSGVDDLVENFYDKLSLSVNDIQVLLLPSKVNWKEYLNKKGDYRYHLLYPVSTKNTLYLSINPSYKKLPKLKIDAWCSSIRLNFSDNKIIKLNDFANKFPLPDVPKTTPINSSFSNQLANKKNEMASRPKSSIECAKPADQTNPKTNKISFVEHDDHAFVEPDDEWEGPFRRPLNINGDPIPNYTQVAFIFNIKDFAIDLLHSNDMLIDEPIDKDYLNFIFNDIRIDLAITKYGLSFKAGLGDLKLVDRIHKSISSNTHTEILSSSPDEHQNQFVKFYFRQVEPDAPNFASLYSKIMTNVLFECSKIGLVCHRTSIVYFIQYAKGITDHLQINPSKEESTLQGDNTIKESQKKPTTDKEQVVEDDSGRTEFNLIARMNELKWNMYDSSLSFGHMIVNKLSVNYNLSGAKTYLKTQLSEIFIHYDNNMMGLPRNANEINQINEYYKQIISCTGEDGKNFFDFDLTLYNTSRLSEKMRQERSYHDLVRLAVGKIKVICLVKFVNELIRFIDPIINPLPTLTEQVKEQAIEAVQMVRSVYQDTENEGTKIYFIIHVKSPQVLIPEHSLSAKAFLVDLGNLHISNRFEVKTSVIDEINLSLNNLEIKRVSFKRGPLEVREQVIEPINLNMKVRRAVQNLNKYETPDIDVSTKFNDLSCILSLKSAKLIFAILDENLTEGLNSNMDLIDLNKASETASKLVVPANNNNNNITNINNKDNLTTLTIKEQKEIMPNRVSMRINIELNRIKIKIVELVEKVAEARAGSSKDELNSSSDIKLYVPQALEYQTNFSLLEIQEVLFDYVKYDADAWTALFKMRAVKLDDLRPDSNLAVKEMFIPLSNSYIIEMVYKYENQHSNLEFAVGNLRINLCLPYILKLYQMAMQAIGGNKKKSPAEPSTSTTTGNQQAPKLKSQISVTAKHALKRKSRLPELPMPSEQASAIVNQSQQDDKTSVKQVQPVNNSSMNVRGKVLLPEVILFAVPENFNSKILLMNADLNLQFKSKSNQTELNIDLEELSFRLGEYNNYKKQGIQFLSPCRASISMKQTNAKDPAYYKVYINSLYFNMTQTLYEVVMGVVNTINMSGTEKVKEESEKKKLLEDAEPFVQHKIERNQYESETSPNDVSIDEDLRSTVSSEKEEEEEIEVKKSNKLSEGLDLIVKEAYITFCEELGAHLQPLTIVKLGLNGHVANWTSNLHLKTVLSLEASYYNDRISNWEPLIENVMECEDVYRPWLLNLWFAMEPGSILKPPAENRGIEQIEFPVKELDSSELRIDDETAEPEAIDVNNNSRPKDELKPQTSEKMGKEDQGLTNASFIQIESKDSLNFNVTPSAYKVIMYLAQLTAGSNQEVVENKVKLPIKFFNFLGESCDLIVTPDSVIKPEYAVGFNVVQLNERQLNILEEDNMSEFRFDISQIELASKDRIQKIVYDSQRSQIDSVYNDSYKFYIQLRGYEKCKLSMKNDGSFLIQLRESKDENQSTSALPRTSLVYNMMYKIRTIYGRTKVMFSSPLTIENNCKVSLYILVEETEVNREYINQLKVASDVVLNSFNESSPLDKTTYAVVFKLLPSKIYYVPLYVAYNCKLYTAPENRQFMPTLLFDIKAYNFRIEHLEELNCRRLECNQKEASASFVNSSDFQVLKQLTLNVRNHRIMMPYMHANYKVSLFPPANIANCLPLPIRIDLDQNGSFSTLVEPGENLNIHLFQSRLNNCNVHIGNYLNANWIGVVDLTRFVQTSQNQDEVLTERVEMSIAPTTEMQVSGKHLSIYLSYRKPNEYMFFCPYWLVNKSGLPIRIKPCDSPRVYDILDDCILMFDYKHISKKNKVRMCVKNGKWSSAFSLETAGTTGMIQCKDESRTYNFLMRITMSNSSRAKLITFAPFLSIANHLDEEIYIREWYKNDKYSSANEWKRLDPISDNAKSIAFWPNLIGEGKQVSFVVKTAGNCETQAFPLENPGRFVLIATNKEARRESTDSSGPESAPKLFTVLISGGSQNPVAIVIRKYEYGDAVAKFVNLCEHLNVFIRQKNTELNWKIQPFNSMFFVWPELIKSIRELHWSINTVDSSRPGFEYFELSKLTKSGTDKETVYVEKQQSNSPSESNNDSTFANDTNNLLPNAKNHSNHSIENVYCVSYIDGTQRVIVFTTDHSLADIERRKESSSMEIFLSLKGMQVSVINNVNLEIATISIKDSRPLWSVMTGNETKMFSNEYSNRIEKHYCDYLVAANKSFADARRSRSTSQMAKDLGVTFDFNFDTMSIQSPEKGQLKRVWRPGLSVQYRSSRNMNSFICCIHKVQIDNQLPDAYFPISLYKAPLNLKDLDKLSIPFMTMSFFTEQQEVTQIYRYIDCVLQEFYLKVDKGFILSLKDWYDAASTNTNDIRFVLDDEEVQEPANIIVLVDQDKKLLDKMNTDIKLTKEIMEYVNPSGAVKQSAHIRFDEFYLSPIVFNLSFSVNGTAHTDDKEVPLKPSEFILNFFLESIGATITEFKDVKFKFRLFNVNNQTKTWKELYDEIFDHYKIQVLHQAYVLILGLDVLGNPFGLVTDFSQGLTDLFYDPLLDYFSKSNTNNDKLKLDMSNKIKSTVNRTISSAAGSGSLISGSIGRVLATVTFDQEYKTKRQYKLSKSSTTTFPDALTIAGKGIAAGCIYGLTGIIRSPLEESKEGAKGVIKGVGKGFLGLFAKPIGSLFDGVSLSLDGLRKLSQSGAEEITNIRLPRHLINDVAILPYSEYQARGYEILRDLQIDDIAENESYWAHIFLESKNLKTLLFITDANIYKLKKTHTQILKKWRMMETPIALNKITQIKVVPMNVDDLNRTNNKNWRKSLHLASVENPQRDFKLFELYVSCSKMENYKLADDVQKVHLFTSDLDTVQWIFFKISSAKKFNKELKHHLDI